MLNSLIIEYRGGALTGGGGNTEKGRMPGIATDAKSGTATFVKLNIQNDRTHHPPRKVWFRVSTALVGGSRDLRFSVRTRSAPRSVSQGGSHKTV